MKRIRKYKVIKREDDWTSWENYEDRLKKRLSDSVEVSAMRDINAVEYNKYLHSQHDIGNIIFLFCKSCKKSQPYYYFHFDQTYKNGRRTSKCKKCFNKVANSKYKKKDNKNEKDIIRQFSISIRTSLSKMNKKYYNISFKKIWSALPYTKEQFIEHIKKNLEPWMNWNNNRHPKPGIKCWHLDHIVPKSSFQYTCVDDEEFKKCWALSNLRPIEAITNIVKSNHIDLHSFVSAIFRKCVVRKKKSKYWDSYFNYTAEEARKHLQKDFIYNMNWSNFAIVWNIDHIIPRAALPYNSVTEDNFIKLWSLENIRPLLAIDNSRKSSKYEDKKYFAFDTGSINMVSINPNLATG